MLAVSVNVQQSLESLIKDEDTDGDKRITIEDEHVHGTRRGDKRFWLTAADGQKYEVAGTYYLSNLLQELTLLKDSGKQIAELNTNRIFEPPADRISRSIREIYWDGLTRRIDERGFPGIVSDEKTASVDGYHHVYTPPSDHKAYECLSRIVRRFPDLKAKVDYLPRNIPPGFGYHGLLSLAIDNNCRSAPFVVPGGRFNEMYGWDSYFIVLGLLQDGRWELAKSMVDNLVYEISYYGKILNANRTYYLTRSQPPFLTSMALAVYERSSKDASNKEWLKGVLAAVIKEHDQVWMSPSRLTRIGLSRYFDSGSGPPPEVEPGAFDVVYLPYAKKSAMDPKKFEAAYKSGKLKVPGLDRYFVHDRCMRESGHDTTYRLENRCADLATVDLNSLLYKMERDIAETIGQEYGGILRLADGVTESSEKWNRFASKRKALINQYLWNSERGMYFDYDLSAGRQLDYVSATTFYPLWAGIASKEQAASLVHKALPLLEMSGGIVASTEQSRGPITPEHPLRQWDYPYGWSPHQILAWLGLVRYGYDSISQRLVYRWLYTITINAVQYNGTVPEKFDVVTRSHQVFAEYGNVGTKFAYITREGFGWTNASYQLGMRMLSPGLKVKLNQLIPPEWIVEITTRSQNH